MPKGERRSEGPGAGRGGANLVQILREGVGGGCIPGGVEGVDGEGE